MRHGLWMICLLFLTIGCERQVIEVADGALFCDVEEPRRFSQEELDWRSKNAPWNLRRDFATNATWDRECVPTGEDFTNAQ
jgi:hypothetical protein